MHIIQLHSITIYIPRLSRNHVPTKLDVGGKGRLTVPA